MSILEFALTKIDRDLDFLMGCLRDVLASTGDGERAARLPFGAEVATNPAPDPLDARDIALLSLSFHLLNVVEENAAAQARRLRESTEGLLREPGLWGQNLRQLSLLGISEEAIAEGIARVRVEPVLTAHPTEAKPPDVLDAQRQLYLLLVRRENRMFSPSEQVDIAEEIKANLERLWRTSEFLERKPDVADERAVALHYLGKVFPDVLPLLAARLDHAWRDAGFDPAVLERAGGPSLRFGTWIGGDRDGHPLVTAQVTEATLKELRQRALDLHGENLARLAGRLSLSDRLQAPPASLASAIDDLAARLPRSKVEELRDMHQREPWRLLVTMIAARLVGHGYASPAELRADLARLSDALHEVQADRLVHAEVAPVVRAIDTFGFHLASLDVRQNSTAHDRALAELLRAAGIDAEGFEGWDEARRRELLDRELASPRPLAPVGAPIGAFADATLDAFRVLARERDAHGTSGIGQIIVSMTRGVSDLLVVYVFLREVGLARRSPAHGGALACALPVVPLFETVEDLENAPRIVEGFLDHPVTRASLAERGGERVVDVMLGYSDSCKTAGILASQWGLHRAQQRLAAVAGARGASCRFFHGRGGTVSRGAGPTHRFLEALPHGSLGGDVRVTEQGETIAQKYANKVTATYHLELLLAGVAATALRHGAAPPSTEHLAPILDRLAEKSRDAYRALVDTDGFLTYFAQATPIDALEEAHIGSRPARRTGRRSLDDLRAIPWVFAWNQSRHYLPGWYGLGTALAWLRDDDEAQFQRIAGGARRHPFLGYLLKNVESAVASAALDIARDYASLVGDAAIRDAFYERVADEHRRTSAMIDALFGEAMAERRPRMWRTLKLRDRGLRTLHAFQVETLRKWRAARAAGDAAAADALLPNVLLSLNAIASGLRTTG